MPLVPCAYEQMRFFLYDRTAAKRLFENYGVYREALRRKGDGTVMLHTRDGLSITIRRNIWDARIIREIFVDKCYVRHVTLGPNPIIIDIGGYIGDFSIYAAKYLKAARVIVYEPIAENFTILKRNIEDNAYNDRIVAVNKAVGVSDQLELGVEIGESEEVHASAYMYPKAERRKVPSVTLSELFKAHELESVDLLKVDCEGGEYDIFPSVPDQLFSRISNIVFEYHRVYGFEAKLDRVLGRLRSAGYRLRMDEPMSLISAYRA
jgi:FkbM family methyltransferase